MSGSATPERDHQLLDIGQQCSEASCLVVDFLPFKCQHCSHAYCGDHFLPTAHHCEKYDAAKLDRIAPSCPLCNTPVAIPPGQDPNIRMEQHINTQCSVMTGKSAKAKSTPTCARPKCGKVLFAPIRCDSCKHQYCPQHRFPADHSCADLPSSSAKTTSTAKTWTNVSNQTSAASAAAVAALKRAAASTTAPSPASHNQVQSKSRPPAQAAPKSIPSTSRSNPFSATDRRAKAERESRRKAIQERARKGLPITEEEKAILAEGGGKDDCLVM
ncbi:AN1-type zinc finger protein 2B [Trametes pubescens]|uniref:AN1-type zinc finger protein 2B n=1 Tax=Trametes pubescens TaxID=154538 RepID=A0A1M2W490_TRAPU|nr:AN1-type zinc finger protein 2B [Trametes pubescens]